MESWQRNLQIAAAGVAAAAVVELVAGGERPRWQSLGRCLLAGGVACAYGQLVPASSWGPRSGIAFAQLPWVASMQSNLGDMHALELAGWGGLTGLLLRWMRSTGAA